MPCFLEIPVPKLAPKDFTISSITLELNIVSLFISLIISLTSNLPPPSNIILNSSSKVL